MFNFCRLLAAAGLIAGFAATATAADTTKDAPKAPPSQSSYTPDNKTGAKSPAKPAPAATDKTGAPVGEKK